MKKEYYIYISILIAVIAVYVLFFKKMKLPVRNARLTSPYGNRTHPITGNKKFHNGIDLASPIGTPIKAPAFGFVDDVNYSNAGGNQLFVRHLTGGFRSGYAHLDKVHVKKGDFVYIGQHIADVGNTGQSTGPHLHLSLRKNGQLVNPQEYFI